MKKREPVSHIMSTNVHCVLPTQNLLEVRELMDKKGVRHVPVLAGADLVGIISRTDVMRASYGVSRLEEEEQKQSLRGLRAEQVMSPNPVAVGPDTSIRESAELLAELDFSALPVLDQGVLIGIVTTTDLIRYLLEQY
ncbi:MAG: CBS domain-containing protein [Candidatus Sericytochromatia bacterium]